MSSSLAKLDAAIEGLRKDIAEFRDLIAQPRLYVGDTQRVLTKTPPKKCPCNVHKRYQAIMAPRVECEACWAYFREKNP